MREGRERDEWGGERKAEKGMRGEEERKRKEREGRGIKERGREGGVMSESVRR